MIASRAGRITVDIAREVGFEIEFDGIEFEGISLRDEYKNVRKNSAHKETGSKDDSERDKITAAGQP